MNTFEVQTLTRESWAHICKGLQYLKVTVSPLHRVRLRTPRWYVGLHRIVVVLCRQPVFEWYMTRRVFENKHQKGMGYVSF